MHTARKIATIVAAGGLGLGLLGAGVGASFTDGATASQNVNVGTFGIQVSSTTPGAVTSTDGKTVTMTVPAIQGSAAGAAPLVFTVKDVGTAPATVTVVATKTGDATFTDSLVNPGAVVIAPGATHDYNGGLAWPQLGNADLSQTATVTYAISATG